MHFASCSRLFGTAKKYVIKSAAKHIVFRIENAIKGKALDPKSDQMNDLVAYIKSLKGKAAEKTKKAD